MKPSLSSNTKALGTARFLDSVSTEMIAPLLPLFLTKILFGPAIIVGIMESLDEFVAGMRVFFPGLRLDMIRRRTRLVFGYSLSAIIKSLLLSVSSWPQAAGIRVLGQLGDRAKQGPQDEIIVLSEGKDSINKAFDFMKIAGNAGMFAGPLLATMAFILLDSAAAESYRIIFMVATIAAVLAAIAMIPVQDKEVQAKHAPKTITVPHGTLHLFAVAGVLALGQFSVMFFVLRAWDFLPLALIPVIYLAYNSFHSIFSLPAGILADKIGPKVMMLLGMGSLLLALAAGAFFTSFAGIFFAFALLGISMSTAKTVPQVFLWRMARKEMQPAMAAYKGVVGIVRLPANMIAGILWTVPLFGAPAAFTFAMATTALAIVLLLLMVKD